jgi:hypothetical protein
MIVLRLLLVLCLALSAVGWLLPELWHGAALPLGLISAAAVAVLTLWYGIASPAVREERLSSRPLPKARGGLFRRPVVRPKILVDGSNVLHWAGQGPDIETLRGVLREIDSQGLEPIVYFDANVGYLVGDRWLGPGPMSRKLGLGFHNVVIAEKGTPADPLLLDAARRSGARIVTNDRYRDWYEMYPEAAAPERAVRGWAGEGRVSLAL